MMRNRREMNVKQTVFQIRISTVSLLVVYIDACTNEPRPIHYRVFLDYLFLLTFPHRNESFLRLIRPANNKHQDQGNERNYEPR